MIQIKVKKISSLLMIAAILISCGKENQYSSDFATVAFINAAPATTAAPAPFTVYVDTMIQTAAIAYRSNSGYITVKPGQRNIELRNVVNFQTVKYAELPATSFETNTASSIFVYDTLTSGNQKFKVLRLSDDLSLPPTGSVKVRFVPLAVNAPALDVTFLRTSVTPNDSVTLTSRSYIGANPTAAAIQAASTFSNIPLGSYTIKLKPAGTQIVSASTTATLNGTTGFYGIYSIYSTGTAQGQPLAISTFNHYR
jgi:hypothetical protein